MKRSIIFFITVVAMTMFASCNKFLDVLPDSRIELDNIDAVSNLLVTAYPNVSSAIIQEISGDNIADNGPDYGTQQDIEELYNWKPVSTSDQDDPQSVYTGFYNAVGTANVALEAIRNLGGGEAYNPQKGEALMCRAYSMFLLSNVFCLSYNPETADRTLGLPYPTEPEKTLNPKYSRGNMKELYENINKDIEEGLQLIDERAYNEQLKYHFNKRAAYAFAARFNLFYMKYAKTIEYANKALGDAPVFRDYAAFQGLNRTDLATAYRYVYAPANLMLVITNTESGQVLAGGQSLEFKHNHEIAAGETFWPRGPWGTFGNIGNFLYYATSIYGDNNALTYPSVDAVRGTSAVVQTAFTTDETLLCRAEAYTLLKRYEEAARDLNTWQRSHCRQYIDGPGSLPDLTVESINSFFGGIPYTAVPVRSSGDRTIKKRLSPQGFRVEEGTQENLIHCVLHMRRLETFFTGMRFNDIKRYGIEFSHNIWKKEPIIFKAGDLRGAIQIPDNAINAGLSPNPR